MALKHWQGTISYIDKGQSHTSWWVAPGNTTTPESITGGAYANSLICWDSGSNLQTNNLTEFFQKGVFGQTFQASTKYTTLELKWTARVPPIHFGDTEGITFTGSSGYMKVYIVWGVAFAAIGSNWTTAFSSAPYPRGLQYYQSTYATRQSIAGKAGIPEFNIPLSIVSIGKSGAYQPVDYGQTWRWDRPMPMLSGISLNFAHRNIQALPVPNGVIMGGTGGYGSPHVTLDYTIVADNGISTTVGTGTGTGTGGGDVSGTKISNLEEASSLSDTDLLVVAQDDDASATYDQTRNIQWSNVKTSIGGTQTWEDVRADRVTATTYQNTTVHPIVVSVTGNQGASASWYMTGHVGATAGSLLEVFKNSFHLYENTTTVVITVPAGHYYQVNHSAGDPSVVAWHELR